MPQVRGNCRVNSLDNKGTALQKLTRSRSLKHSSEGHVNTSLGPLSCHDLLSLNRKYCVCESLGLPITVRPRDCHSQEYEKFALADLTDTSDSGI